MTLSDTYINQAVEAVAIFLMPEDGAIDKAYTGDISGMGATIVNAGVLTTLKFYEILPKQSDDTNAHTRRNRVLQAIGYILTSNPQPEPMSQWYNAQTDKPAAARRIVNAATALKLAIRCYHQKENQPL
jgi:hypothetical protein